VFSNPGALISDSSTAIPLAPPALALGSSAAESAASGIDASVSAFQFTTASLDGARSLPLLVSTTGTALSTTDSADLVLSVELPAALPPIGVPSSVNVLVFNRGSADAASGTRLTLIVPEGARSTSNPGWLTQAGQPCDDRVAGTPCVLELPPVAAGERLALGFGFRLAQVLPLDFRAIQLAARLEPDFSDPTPVDDEVLATLSFATLPDRISLRGLDVPQAENLGDFIADQQAAEQLGKLLFWDMQVGSDGKQACASCHFNAGADSRSHNQLNPGQPALGDQDFGFGGPNAELSASDFPLHQLSDPSDRNSAVLRSRDEVVSSQGVRLQRFEGIGADAQELGSELNDPVFQLGGTNLRRVEARNTPTVINAAFNDRNFWDGRAQNIFNGQNPFGTRDENARVLRRVGASVQPVAVAIEFSSLASQAVGPPVSAFEMSFDGRSWPHVGKKLLGRDQPLAAQHIHPEDSLLGALSRWPEAGALRSYSALIRAAFRPEWWDADVRVQLEGGAPQVLEGGSAGPLGEHEYTLMMYNFSLFFGLAVQAYEGTLISDDAPFDRYIEGDSDALSPEQQRGLALFFGSARCSNCHGGPFFTNASITRVQNQPLERMLLGDDQLATYDNGYYNIGVRPTAEDLGVGGLDPFGLPLSNTGLAQLGRFARDNVGAQPDERIAVSGSFKAPSLRNVALTAPYFHNGGQQSLRQVLEFYRRGGDFANRADKDPDVIPLVLSDEELDSLVSFLESLTDERVQSASAPFDHPELVVPDGALSDAAGVTLDAAGAAQERQLVIPAVGKSGGAPLPHFLQH
jgi:cytochrome c peroxidase